jgi:hypothetical protein
VGGEAAMTILRLTVTDGSRRPALAESVAVDQDGRLDGWRTVSDRAVGWFAGRLPAAELAELRALAAEVPQPVVAPPGAARETLELPGAGPIPIAGIDGGLADAARRLLERLTDFPRAAVAVSFRGPGRARLEHRGPDPVRLDLRSIDVRAYAWRGYYEPAGDWATVVDGPDEIEAGPGWTYDVPLKIDAAPDAVIHLTADFAIRTGDARHPVQAQFTPPIPPP